MKNEDVVTSWFSGANILSAVLMLVSLAVTVCAGIWIYRRLRKKKRSPEKDYKQGISTALGLLLFVLVAILLLRFSVYSYNDWNELNLTCYEEISNSLFGALRTFSMEEDYATFVKHLKETISEMFKSADDLLVSGIKLVMVSYSAVLHFVAPIIGGAVVLVAFYGIITAFQLRLAYINGKRPKYFFSELNAASLSLAKSIYCEEKDKNPVLIFTDTYVDDEKEKEYELLLEAKKYGAVCIRDDLAHVAKTSRGDISYFLMDENELANLQTLMDLTEEQNIKFIKGSGIYMFVQSDVYVRMEKQVNVKLEEYVNKGLLNEDEIPVIVPINGYRNLVHNLFVEVPLYEPLINKKDKTKLNVTIMGNGIIGTEAFLSAYWFGQMFVCQEDGDGKKIMSECEMTVNVVSKDSEKDFWSKIDYVNPEIKQSVTVLHKGSSESHNNELLAYDNKGNTNSPYCRVRYIQEDVKVGGFWDGDSDEIKEILNSDYFIVALGNDSDNISVSDKLRRMIGKKHLEEEKVGYSGNVIITYAVFNSDIAEILNKQKYFSCRESGKADIFMHVFGSIDQVYSYDNIYMSKSKLLSEGIGVAYDNVNARNDLVKDNKKRKNNLDRDYTYWADMARAEHIKYKAFSLGLMEESVFDYGSDASGSEYEDYREDQCKKYKEIALYYQKVIEAFKEKHKRNSDKDGKAEAQNNIDKLLKGISDKYKAEGIDVLKLNLLAWLEHRRWTAFTRTRGYRYTAEINKNLELNGTNHKNMELKLHPCLIEAKKPDKEYDPNKEYDIYLQEKFTALFLSALDEDIEKLSVEQMKQYLAKKKNECDETSKLLLDIAENTVITDLDFLDQLTYNWCKAATEKSLENIADTLKKLDDVPQTEKAKVFKKAWDGIGCYDFKIYDYLSSDY